MTKEKTPAEKLQYATKIANKISCEKSSNISKLEWKIAVNIGVLNKDGSLTDLGLRLSGLDSILI
jgi:hypothetical protein